MNAPVTLPSLAAIAATVACVGACVLAYLLGQRLWRRVRHHPALHPLLVATSLLALAVAALGVDAGAWRDGTRPLYWLLGPSIVAIAIPVYRQRRTILNALRPVLTAVLVGGTLSPLVAMLLVLPFAPTRELLLTLAPKSVTSAIAYPVAQAIGGLPELAVGVVIITGVVGAICAPWVFRVTRLGDARLQGLVLGVVAHAVGTARAIEMGQRPGAFAGVGLALTGLLTALLLPLACLLLLSPPAP